MRKWFENFVLNGSKKTETTKVAFLRKEKRCDHYEDFVFILRNDNDSYFAEINRFPHPVKLMRELRKRDL